MPIRLSCPSCNTAFTLPEPPADRRANCHRCGDQFPIRTFTEIAESEDSSTRPGTAQLSSKDRAQLSIKRTVLVALGMGLVGLFVGVAGYYFQGNVHPLPPPETPTTNSAIPADQLIGLGYLPDDTNIAFAIQFGPVAAYADKMKKDPREMLVQAGIPPKVFDDLSGAGLSLSQIDHLVGGTYLGDGAVTPRLSLALVLRRPIEKEDEFLHKLQARKRSSKERYDIELAKLPLILARVSPTIWFFGLDEKDFKAVDRGGYGAGGKQFPAGLGQAIVERIPPNATAWLATNDEQWSEKPGVKLLIGQGLIGKKEWLPVLAKGKSALVAFSLDDPPRLRLFIKAVDEKTGGELRKYFQKLASADDAIRQGGGGELAFYDAPIDPMNVFAALSRFLADAGK